MYIKIIELMKAKETKKDMARKRILNTYGNIIRTKFD